MKKVIEFAKRVYGDHVEFNDAQTQRLQEIEALVRADEREACAKVAENCFEGVGKHKPIIMAVEAAKAIRARGNT